MSRNVNVPTLTAAQAALLGVLNLGRPDPAVANNSRFGSLGDAWYDGFTLASTTRRNSWWTSRVSYTLSKALDTAGNAFFSSPQDSTNIADEKGLSANDQRHRLVASGTASMPDGATGLAPRAARGFQASAIASYGLGAAVHHHDGQRSQQRHQRQRSPCRRRAQHGARVVVGVGRSAGVAAVPHRRARTEVLAEAFNLFNRTNLQLPNGVGAGARRFLRRHRHRGRSAAGATRRARDILRIEMHRPIQLDARRRLAVPRSSPPAVAVTALASA